MIRLYHGSSVEVRKPLVGVGRRKVDFGQGCCQRQYDSAFLAPQYVISHGNAPSQHIKTMIKPDHFAASQFRSVSTVSSATQSIPWV